MERRKFLKNGLTVFLGTAISPNLLFSSNEQDLSMESNRNAKLKGFIVSDAHFGWTNGMQPEPDFQREMMKRIMTRFPDLDVFLDTGDAHHNDHHDNSNPYLARKNWSDIIQGGCGQVPFYYVVGNHEIYSNEDDDPEIRSNIMGSTSCRPYYSFDIKGIHFISFPELIKTVHITEEEYAWLDLDLRLNKNRTTILLSHNNIIGTTSGNEPGYRGLMDSEKMLEIFREYPNVISWMHGHNHNFEILEKQNMLFVSNGRIGGFDPSKGLHGIGGIYFEISKDGLLVKCYSAEKDIFLEDISSNMTKKLNIQTTINNSAPYSYSYGVGGAKNKERFSVYNHHAGLKQKREIFITGCQDAIINEDPFFEKYVERPAWHGLAKILIAAKINHENRGFEYTNPGIRLKASDDWFNTVTLPCENFNLYSYYRCPVDTDYKIAIDFKTPQIPITNGFGPALWLRLIVHNSNGKILHMVQSGKIILISGEQKHEVTLNVPPLHDFDTIYSNPYSDELVNIAVIASFSGMKKVDVDIRSIMFSIADADGNTKNPGLLVNNEKCLYNGEITRNEIIKLSPDSEFNERDVVETSSEGMQRFTFITRHSNLDWQVRNAAVKDCGKYLEIKKMRNRLSDKMEIIIVPLFKTKEPYIHRIRKSEEIRIYPISRGNSNLKVEIGKISKDSQIEIFSYKRPDEVTNVSSWNYENNIITAKISNTGKIYIRF